MTCANPGSFEAPVILDLLDDGEYPFIAIAHRYTGPK